MTRVLELPRFRRNVRALVAWWVKAFQPVYMHGMDEGPCESRHPENCPLVGDEALGVRAGGEVTARDDEAFRLVIDDGGDFGMPVADAFVLHQNDPAHFGAVFYTADVLDLFVCGHAVVFGQSDQIPAGGAEQFGDGYPAQTAVDEELMRLYGWRHGGRPRPRLYSVRIRRPRYRPVHLPGRGRGHLPVWRRLG